MIDAFTIAGTLDQCRSQLEPYWACADSIRLEVGGHRLDPARRLSFESALDDLRAPA